MSHPCKQPDPHSIEPDLSTSAVSTCTVSASGGSMSASINNPDFAMAKRNR